ncbi:MAG: hypothetical protein ABI895_02955 [Deltaproteobacteria bacterium]
MSHCRSRPEVPRDAEREMSGLTDAEGSARSLLGTLSRWDFGVIGMKIVPACAVQGELETGASWSLS